jgi:hypothetical protein
MNSSWPNLAQTTMALAQPRRQTTRVGPCQADAWGHARGARGGVADGDSPVADKGRGPEFKKLRGKGSPSSKVVGVGGSPFGQGNGEAARADRGSSVHRR